MTDKEAQKRQQLAPWVKLAEANLLSGIKSLRYWCVPEADSYEAQLKSYHKILVDMTGDKTEIKNAAMGVEETVFAMMYQWATNFCGCNQWKCDPTYTDVLTETIAGSAPTVTPTVSKVPVVSADVVSAPPATVDAATTSS